MTTETFIVFKHNRTGLFLSKEDVERDDATPMDLSLIKLHEPHLFKIASTNDKEVKEEIALMKNVITNVLDEKAGLMNIELTRDSNFTPFEVSITTQEFKS